MHSEALFNIPTTYSIDTFMQLLKVKVIRNSTMVVYTVVYTLQ